MLIVEIKAKVTTPVLEKETASTVMSLVITRKQIQQHQRIKRKRKNVKAIQEESSTPLVDPALVTVLGVAKDRQGLNSEETSSIPSAKARKKQSSEESSSRNAKDKKSDSSTIDKGKSVKKSPAKVAKPSTDTKLELLD